jgi:hypothetical protein
MKSAILLTSWILCAAVPAGAQCPVSYIGVGCSNQDWAGIESALPGAQVSGEPWQSGMPCTDGCYDIPHGTLVANGSWNIYNGGCGSNPMMRDEFTVVGVAEGTPIRFSAHLIVQGAISGKGRIWAAIGDNLAGSDGLDTQVSGPVIADVSTFLECTAGVPFLLATELGAAGTTEPGGTVSATATLRFTDLPAGSAVVSCQKYDVPVPALTRTWGSVKGTYR